MEPRPAAVPAGTPLAARPGLTLAWTHPPTHPAIAKLVTLARELAGYRPPGAT
jgi:hypothetical protein